MKLATKFLLSALLAASPVLAFANQCDCQTVVGTCQGAVQVTKAFGSAPSYGAEVEIYSSERVCSKVEYFVDGTPYQTMLVNRNKDTENVFGTSPISSSSVRFSACKVCKSASAGGVDGRGASGDTPGVASGTCTPGENRKREGRGVAAHYGSLGCDTHYVFGFGSTASGADGIASYVDQLMGSACPGPRTVIEEKSFIEQDWGPRPRRFVIFTCGDSSALQVEPISRFSASWGPDLQSSRFDRPPTPVRRR